MSRRVTGVDHCVNPYRFFVRVGAGCREGCVGSWTGMNSRKPSRKKNLSVMKMLGAQVATGRRAAGLTQRGLAERLMVDEETIASIEQGRRPLKPDLAELLDQLLGTKGMLAAAVENLPEIDQFPLYAEQYMAHERE